jgi:tetratricopeptide (TPR) repeat protein
MNPSKSLSRFLAVCSLCVIIGTHAGAQGQEAAGETARKASVDEVYYDAVKAHILGDDKTSDSLLKVVIAARPDEPAPYYDLSRQALKANDADKAAGYIRKAIALDGKNKWYREQYANVLTLHSDYAAAADEYANLAKTEKFNEQYLERGAMLYQRSGKFKESLALLELLRKKNNDEDVLLQEEQLYLKMNDVEGAARIMRELIAQHPKEPRYYSVLIEIYENNKQPEKAKAALDEMSRKFPTDPSLQIALASDAQKKGDTAKFREYTRKVVVNKDLDAETQLNLLRSYVGDPPADSLRLKDAISMAAEILTQHPDHVGLLSYYGYMLTLSGNHEAAIAQFKKAVGLKKDEFVLWQQLLSSYTDKQDADSLIKWSEKAARLFPNQATVHYLNGIGHSNKKEYAQAITAINRAIDLEPEEKTDELSMMLTTLGDIYNSTKEYALSDSTYNRALRLSPHNAALLNNYAYYLSVRNTRLSDAAKMSEESLKIRPGEGTFLDTYAWILYQQGKYHDALTYIQKAIAADKNNTDPTLWEHMGAIQYRLGNKDAAVDAWKKAKERGSENAAIDKMIAEQKLYE